jgi:2-keto-4-pentenoate hydratase
VQAAGTALRMQAGERLVGWKLGYTSAAMRRQMGIDQANAAPLTDAMLLASGAVVGERATQPRVEPEIGVVLAHPLTGLVSRTEAQDAVGAVLACLEVVDSVYTGYDFTLQDNTADGSSAAFVVVGDSLAAEALDETPVLLEHNGESVAASTGAAAMGHPLEGVRWLAAHLAARGEALAPGQLIITGGLTGSVALLPGDEVAATFADAVRVVVRG